MMFKLIKEHKCLVHYNAFFHTSICHYRMTVLSAEYIYDNACIYDDCSHKLISTPVK